jgi:hypothetical protein
MKISIVKILTLLLFFSSAFEAVAQDKVQLMSGKTLTGKVTKEYDGYYDFTYYKKGGKTKEIELTKYRVFSLTDSKGTEDIIYKQDSLLGSFYSKNEMKMQVFGQRDAYSSYQSAPLFFGGFALGFGSVLFDTYEFDGSNTGFFKRSPSVAPIIVPIVLTIGSGMLKTKIKRAYASDATYLNNEFYIQGFQKVAKTKRIKSTFLGSVIGMATGFVVYSLAK